MDLEIRLAALTKLLDIKSEDADRRLSQEFAKAQQALRESVAFAELSEALKILGVLSSKYHAATIPLLTEFTLAIQTKKLMHGDGPLAESLGRYQTPSSLIREAIEVAERIRYVQTEEALDFFLELSRIDDKEVHDSAQRAIDRIAEFDIGVFYDRQQGTGPQRKIVDHLSKMAPENLVKDGRIILQTLAILLSFQ